MRNADEQKNQHGTVPACTGVSPNGQNSQEGTVSAWPEWLRKAEIAALARLTAKACGVPAPSMRGCNAAQRLVRYRTFTTGLFAGRTSDELSQLRDAMYQHAFRAGRALAHLPGHGTDIRKRQLVVQLYRTIGITIEGDLPGTIRIPRCSFASAYTPQMCHVMSGMDAGIICGIFGGGTLKFQQRLTEGCAVCLAAYEEGVHHD